MTKQDEEATEEKPNLHFMVVDDDAESRATVIEYLKSLGYEKISNADNGAKALRILEHDPSINFIISDWDMPTMDGLTFLKRIRSDQYQSHLPFLVVTSPVSKEIDKVILAAENMVDGYIIKPFRIHILQEKINEILSRSIHGPQKQVLLAEDDVDAMEMVTEFLQALGFKDLASFTEGRSALEYIIDNHYKLGLIISDWEMPGLTGLDLLKHCKSNPTIAQIPFLIITSPSSMARFKVVQAAKASVDQYLLKPFKIGDFKKKVDSLLENNRSKRQVQECLRNGFYYLDHGFHSQSKNHFNQALKLDPNQDQALRGMGEALRVLKGLDAAIPYFKKAVEANPYNIKNYIKLAAAYEQAGLVDKAITLLESAADDVSFSADLHFQLGQLYYKKDMVSKAKAEFERTLELRLDHQQARVMLDMLDGVKSSKRE